MANVPAGPPSAWLMLVENAFWSRNVPLLKIVAKLPKRISPLLAAVLPLQVVVPDRFSVRAVMSCGLLPVIDRPPSVLVAPLPLMLPPDQVAAPVTSSAPVPDKKPPL